MQTNTSERYKREIEHGQFLAAQDPERIWGWSGKAGKQRAIRRAKKIISGAKLKPGMTALEVGCGTGFFTNYFAESGCSLIAVDISRDLLNVAKKRMAQNKQVQFYTKSYHECECFAPYDAIIGSSVLHHLDIETTFDNLFQMLKPSGRLCFAEPNMLNPQIFLQKNIPWLKKISGDSPDETAFIRWYLKAELVRKGFVDVKIFPFDWLHPGTPSRLVNFMSKISRSFEKISIIREFSGSLLICCKKHHHP